MTQLIETRAVEAALFGVVQFFGQFELAAIIENSRMHDINRAACASVVIYGNDNKSQSIPEGDRHA
jgi:hypothetical protein